jgi:preprotein translocase subunit SecF
MKRLVIILSALLFTIALSGTIYAKYKNGYEVTGKTEESVMIKGKGGDEIKVQTDPKEFEVGDKVEYDAKKNKLKKEVQIEGC